MSSNKAQDEGTDKMEVDGQEKDIDKNDLKKNDIGDKKQESIKNDKDDENGKSKNKDIKNEESENDDETDEEDDEEESEGEHKVPLLDQPLEQTGTRERKKVQRFTSESKKLEIGLEIPHGKGTGLGKIPRIEAKIMKNKADDLKILHRVLFNRNPPKPSHIKNNIRKFKGFEFKKDSDLYDKKFAFIQKFEMKQLKELCDVLDLMKKGASIDIAERILGFLMEPKDSGKPLPNTATPTRSKNNSKKGKKGSATSSKAKRTSKKVGNSSEEEEEEPEQEEEEDEEESDPIIEEDSKKPTKRKAASLENSQSKNQQKENDEDSVEDENKEDLSEGSESAEENPAPGKQKGKGKKVLKVLASNKKTAGKKRKSDEISDQEKEDNESEKEEPEAKKSKTPPTDDEIQTYVKQILEGANLEEITMKTVCEQVYAHYPDFDLAHKKAFIKTTVKSLIST